MFPRCRTADEPFVLPPFDVQVSDVEGFMDELQAFQSLCHDCCARSEARAHFLDDMVGPYSPLARKSLEPLALAMEGRSIRSLQRCLSETVWDEEQMRWNYHQLVADELGEPDGVLRFEASGFVKKGNDAAGVARPDGGTLGQVETGQVGVLAGYAARQGDALVDQRLLLPEGWCPEAYAARQARGQGPAEVTLQPKPQLAAALLHTLVHEGLLPFTSVVADCLYGNRPDFLDAVDA